MFQNTDSSFRHVRDQQTLAIKMQSESDTDVHRKLQLIGDLVNCVQQTRQHCKSSVTETNLKADQAAQQDCYHFPHVLESNLVPKF